jgi:hypothetical protein
MLTHQPVKVRPQPVVQHSPARLLHWKLDKTTIVALLVDKLHSRAVNSIWIVLVEIELSQKPLSFRPGTNACCLTVSEILGRLFEDVNVMTEAGEHYTVHEARDRTADLVLVMTGQI